MTNPLPQAPFFKALRQHFLDPARAPTLRDLYHTDPARRSRYTAEAAGIRLHYDQNLIDDTTLELFEQAYSELGIEHSRQALFAGEAVNFTEARPALHTALRSAITVGSGPYHRQIREDFQRCCAWVEKILRHELKGSKGQAFTDIVNLGIGGSDLGPRLACSALQDFQCSQLTIHFVSSLDCNALEDTLASLNPATTLFIVSSKSFSTEETLVNAVRAQQWLRSYGLDTGLQMAAVTAKTELALALGVQPEYVFPLQDWVGGRYSLWSAIGLPLMLQIGPQGFTELLAGAHAMDEHFCQAPMRQNLPLLLAALELWNNNFCGLTSLAVLPYSYRLRMLPAYLQQLTMESNGKQVDRDGNPVTMATNPIVWGSSGTEGQHSFHQLLHQGTADAAVDFILPGSIGDCAEVHGSDAEASLQLTAHCLAQREALLEGKSTAQACAELVAGGMTASAAAQLAPHKRIPGNRPCNLLRLAQVTPRSLGALLALYEQKTFACGVLWGINSFDQWGVELGKQIGTQIQLQLKQSIASGRTLAQATDAYLESTRQPQP